MSFMNTLRAFISAMEKINSFFSYLSSPPSSSSRPPQTPSPPSEEPTTFPRKRHSRVNQSKARLDTNSNKVEYLKLPKDSQDRTLLFRFMVYASGGVFPSEVKKVTREAPKQRKSTVDCASSKQAAQYSWVVRHQSRKKRRRSKDALQNETFRAEAGDIATHEEDVHEENSQEEDIHEDDAHEAASCEKSVQQNYSKKSVTFDMSANPPRKSALKATLRDKAPAPRSRRSRF